MKARVAALACALLLLGCLGETESELLSSARTYLDRGETKAAIIQAKKALDKNAGSGAARTLLGVALLEDRDPVAAEIELRKALEGGTPSEQVVPALALAMLQLGQGERLIAQFGGMALSSAQAEASLKTSLAAAHAQRGDRERARSLVQDALRLDPTHVPASLVAARLAADDGDVDAALRTIDTVLARDPTNELAAPVKADLLWFARHDRTGAMELHRRVLEKHPRTIRSHVTVLNVLLGDGQVDAAREQLARLKAAAPTHPETLYFEANLAVRAGELRRARELLDLVLVGAPDHARALELAAAAEYRLGNDIQAQAFAARALRALPDLSLARQILARSELRSGRPARALEALQPLLGSAHPGGPALVLAGQVHLALGDAAKADAAFRRAAQVAPADPAVRTAAALARQADPASAVRELEAIAAGDAGVSADLALVSSHIVRADAPAALKAIASLQAKMPASPIPDQLRGQVLVARRDADGARRAFEAALAKDRRYLPAVKALAALDVAAGNAEGARKRYADLLTLEPRHAQALLGLSAVAAERGEGADKVLDLIVQAVKADPTDVLAHRALVGHHLRTGNRPAALTAAQNAAAALPNDLSMLELLGQVQIAAGNPQQALSTFRRLNGMHPDNAQYLVHVAEAHLALREVEPATRALRRALEVDADQTTARQALALIALRSGKPLEALAGAREWQKRNPRDGAAYALEGDIERSRGALAQAIPAYAKALELSDASEAAIKLHAALEAASRRSEAERLASDWNRRRPGDPAFQFYLGDAASNRNDYAGAERHYRAVLQVQPDNALALNNVAWALLKQSKSGALALAERADLLMPNHAPVLDTLASAQAAAGRWQDAVRTQRRAMAASPQDPGLKLRLAEYLVRTGNRGEAKEHLDALAALGDRFPAQAAVADLRRGL